MLQKKYKTMPGKILLFLLFGFSAGAQEVDKDVSSFLSTMQDSYRHANYLGFHVKYLYANAGQPGKQMDTLSGDVAMDKGRSRFVVDGTETVVTERYAIHVVDEEKLIYLSKPGGNGMVDPVGLLDSLMSHLKGARVRVEAGNGVKMLLVSLPPGQAYSQVRMVMNIKTGWLERMEYDVHTSGLVGEEQITRDGHPGQYEKEGTVTVQFSNYKKGGFGDAMFDEGKFFTREGNEFKPAESYKDYHIFLASTTL